MKAIVISALSIALLSAGSLSATAQTPSPLTTSITVNLGSVPPGTEYSNGNVQVQFTNPTNGSSQSGSVFLQVTHVKGSEEAKKGLRDKVVLFLKQAEAAAQNLPN
jgi:hypothetical protein